MLDRIVWEGRKTDGRDISACMADDAAISHGRAWHRKSGLPDLRHSIAQVGFTRLGALNSTVGFTRLGALNSTVGFTRLAALSRAQLARARVAVPSTSF